MKKNSARLLAVLSIVFSIFSIVHAQVSPELKRQIGLLLQEKESRTPAQQKMESQLIQAVKESRNQKMAAGVNLAPIVVKKNNRGLVLVDIKANVSDALLRQITKAGGRIVNAYPQYNSVRAEIPLALAEVIAAYPEVRFIGFAAEAVTVGAGDNVKPGKNIIEQPIEACKKPKNKGFEKRAASIKKQLDDYVMTLGAGSVNSQGDLAHRTSEVRNSYGYSGQGIRIGVLSDSYNSLGVAAIDVANGDLPGVGNPLGNTTPVTVLTDVTGSDEGRAMMQIVHDVAPKAQLFYASAFNGDADFAVQILALRNTYNCDIIIDDIFYFNEGAFQDGIIAQAVNTVTASGAMYFSSAGNSGNIGKATGGAWEGDFTDAGSTFVIPGVSKGGTIHNWGTIATPINGNIILAKPTSPYLLKWADPLGASTNDYDFFLVNAAGTTVKASSTTIQNGTQDPYEGLSSAPTLATGDRLIVFKSTGAASLPIHVNANRGRLTIVTGGQTHGHSAAADAYSVAATPAATRFAAPTPNGPFPGPFVATNQVETFSSEGLRRIFFNSNGTPVTPGNISFSGNGGVVRNKPDITAADGVVTTLTLNGGLNPFYGTSAAAPHAGAIAALLKSANPALTPAQIRTIITSTALDIEAVGYDNVSGHGIIRAFEAMQAVNPTPLASISLVSKTFSEGATSNGNTYIEAGELGKLAINITNPSLSNATSATAVLTSNTPGVTITSGNFNIGTLNGGSSTNNSGNPFLFAVGPTFDCGATINFTLTITFANGGINSPLIHSISLSLGSTTTINGTIGTAPTSATGYTASSGSQTGRINRAGIVSVCGVARTNPGVFATTGARAYHAYTFTNTGGTSVCVPISMTTTTTALYVAAYNNTGFIPATTGVNWLGDAGSSAATTSFNVQVPAGQSITVVVHEVNTAGATGVSYTLNVGLSLCSAPNVTASSALVTAASCGGTSSLDPGEVVTVDMSLLNSGNLNTNSVTATLLATGGVTNPSAPQTYGVMTAGGPAVTKPFTFKLNGACGDVVKASLQISDGVTTGIVTYNFNLGTQLLTPLFTENFDGVTAPSLPVGWTTTQTGASPPAAFATTTTTPNSAPNAVFTNGVGSVATNSFISPAINVPLAGIKELSFKHKLNFEDNSNRYDGAVLEVSTDGGGSYVDVTDMSIGGTFTSNGYTATINSSFGNPLGGRASWGGISGTYQTVNVSLPAGFGGANIKFRWQAGWDNEGSNSGINWSIDNIILTQFLSVCSSCPEIDITGNGISIADGDITPDNADNTDVGNTIVGGSHTQSFEIHNTGGANLTVSNIVVSGANAALFSPSAITPAGPIAPAGFATFTVTFAPTSIGIKTATITVSNNDADEGEYDFAMQGNGYTEGIVCAPVSNRLYVNQSNPNPGNGSTWACALNELNLAIATANGNPAITSIWVAAGTYMPGVPMQGRYNRYKITRANLQILGGFTGNETTAAAANPTLNPTILSGDVGTLVDKSDNAYQIILIPSLPANQAPLVIDGFIIQDGNANGPGDANGGAALYAYSVPASTPVMISRCTFRNNTASGSGGAVNLSLSGFTFNDCRFISNSSSNAGGAMYGYFSTSSFTNCQFIANTATVGGGAFYGNYGTATLNKNIFSGNSANAGGAVYQNRLVANISNSIFNANTSVSGGGAIFSHFASNGTITNNTFFKNTTNTSGGAILLVQEGSAITANNNIFYKNAANGQSTGVGSDITNLTNGVNTWANNILQMGTSVPADNGGAIRNNTRGTNPMFVNEANAIGGDNIWGTADDGLALTSGSLAKNTGDNALVLGGSDIANNARIACGVVDKGAYENQEPCCGASLLATNVTGSLNFNGFGINYFNSNNGYVPAGCSNSSLGNTTVAISNPNSEFCYLDAANNNVANFTDNTLTITDICYGNAAPFEMSFLLEPGLVNSVTEISDNFTNGMNASLVGNLLTITMSGLPAPGTYTAVYSLAGCEATIPNFVMGKVTAAQQTTSKSMANGLTASATPSAAYITKQSGVGSTGIVNNPFNNDLQIRYMGTEKAVINVISANGKTMWSKNNIQEGVTHVDAASWSRGMYQVTITTASGKRMNYKVVKL